MLRVNYHMVIEIEGGQRPACVAELIALHCPPGENCPAGTAYAQHQSYPSEQFATPGPKIKIVLRSKCTSIGIR